MPVIKSKKATISAKSLRGIPRLVISTEETGYTCQYIYGDYENDIDYESIVVPTYKMTLEKDGKVIKTYNVTRDSWYSRGIVDDGFIYDDIELTNRCFEPRDANKNLYSTVALNYHGIDAFALRQYGKENLKAEFHTEKQNTRVKGEMDDKRKKLGEAKGVMIHIGGWYFNESQKRKKLGGSYGCFGFVSDNQRGTKEKIEKWRKNEGYKDVDTSNADYLNFIREIAEARTVKYINEKGVEVYKLGALHVLLKKRVSIEKIKILKNQ